MQIAKEPQPRYRKPSRSISPKTISRSLNSPNEREKKVSFSVYREIQPTTLFSLSLSAPLPLPTFRKTSSVFNSPFFRDSNCHKISLGSCLSAKNKPRTFLTFPPLDFIQPFDQLDCRRTFTDERKKKTLAQIVRVDSILFSSFLFFPLSLFLLIFLFDPRTESFRRNRKLLALNRLEKNYISKNKICQH